MSTPVGTASLITCLRRLFLFHGANHDKPSQTKIFFFPYNARSCRVYDDRGSRKNFRLYRHVCSSFGLQEKNWRGKVWALFADTQESSKGISGKDKGYEQKRSQTKPKIKSICHLTNAFIRFILIPSKCQYFCPYEGHIFYNLLILSKSQYFTNQITDYRNLRDLKRKAW